MNRLCIVGTSWRTGGMNQIARLTLSQGERDERLGEFARTLGLQELLYLATCNRVELACVLSPGAPMDEVLPSLLEQVSALCGDDRPRELSLDCWQGEEAVRHLFFVAAGLDSAQPGEHEIRGQLRRALSEGAEAAHTGPVLTDLVNSALLAARRVHRSAMADQKCPVSLARTALELAQERADHVADEAAAVALFGVSPITIQCAHRLVREGRPLVIVNRSEDRARELLRELDGAREFRACDDDATIEAEALTLDEFRASPRPLVAAISATAAREPILDRATLERVAESSRVHPGKLRFIDMGVPADISPEDAESAGIERLGMSLLNERAQAESAERHEALQRAADLLGAELERYRRRRHEESLGGVLRGIGDQTRATLRTGLDEVVECRIQEIEGMGCGRLDDWAQRMAHRVSHVPFVGLRALAAAYGPGAVEVFLAASDPDLAEDYRRSLAERAALSEEDEASLQRH